MRRLLASLSLIAVSACAAQPGAAPAPSAPGAATAPRVNESLLVGTEWLAANLSDPGLVVLHVGRNRSDYDEAHIPGARFLPIATLLVERDGIPNELPPVAQLDSVFESLGVSDGGRIVVYGEPLLAARTFFTLDYLGHGDRTALLDGGLPVWRAESRALSTEAPTFGPGRFTPRPQPQRVADAGWIASRLRDPRVALIDARPAAEYSGAEAGAGIPRAGHIPGAENIFWQTLLVSNERPVLRDVESLRRLFEGAGASGDRTVVTYCRSGMQASFAYFVSRYLGYESKMYDGSFLDWSPRAQLPVER
jgi:thiosulfate/3-mercaptopyruvate sulfurtransferase